MKKLSFLLASLFLLIGCSANNAEESEPAASSESAVSSEASSTESSEAASSAEESSAAESSTEMDSEATDKDDNDADTEDDEAEVTDQDLEGAETVSNVSDYEELAYAQDKVDFSKLKGYIVTDNPNKRVILFEDGHKKAYKTIFIKNANRLKVIDLQGDGLVLNEKIK